MTRFAEWQPIYARHGLPTFPVRIDGALKKPMAKNYLSAGRPYSDRLAKRFPDANAFGFALGSRTKITVLDCDSNDERVLADAMARHGKSPLIVRSGSGNYQAWFRHNGERRHIRPDPARPIDVLGSGFVVAPPSQGAKSDYQIIAGTLDDLDRLPRLQNFVAQSDVRDPVIPIGQRNDALFRHCMQQARACDDFEALHDVAETFAAQCEQSHAAPMSADEVRKTALSAWSYTQQGRNWVGGRHHDFDRAVFPPSNLAADPFLYTLLCWLRDHDASGRSLMVADALAEVLGWSKHQLREARRRALEGGWIVLVEPPTRCRAARFTWGASSIRYGLCNSEAILSDGPRLGRESVYSQVRNPEAIHCPVNHEPAEVAA
ncbi:bifunctional DNA primase/polymerase [Bradyrhizobium sp. STM 3561]|uniref:bifunctional DNA primase/polymerase n=1 Tax=Bradyrhizobium sp. STM 3561 TaxID=578923 RepID=UPI00388F2690